MISVQQIAASLYGIGLLLRFDPKAWTYFDKSPRGFWMSFSIAFLLAPIQLAHEVLMYSARKPTLDFIPYMVVQVLAYTLSWTLLPFAMLYVTRLLNRTPRYLWHMVPYNWMQLPLGLLLFSAQLLVDTHILPVGVVAFLSPIILVAFAVYGTFIAAIGLQIATGTALAIVVLDFMMGQIADQIINRI